MDDNYCSGCGEYTTRRLFGQPLCGACLDQEDQDIVEAYEQAKASKLGIPFGYKDDKPEPERDLAHEADMAELAREQLRSDVGGSADELEEEDELEASEYQRVVAARQARAKQFSKN